MRVWRLARRPFAALDGEGARLNGGRWNSEGTAMVYTSTTLALAALELLVHVDPADAPDDLVAIAIDVPDALVRDLPPADLPDDWRAIQGSDACAAIGDAWVRAGTSVALRVPSVLVPEESNVLLDPRHADMRKVKLAVERPFSFDPRLVG